MMVGECVEDLRRLVERFAEIDPIVEPMRGNKQKVGDPSYQAVHMCNHQKNVNPSRSNTLNQCLLDDPAVAVRTPPFAAAPRASTVW